MHAAPFFGLILGSVLVAPVPFARVPTFAKPDRSAATVLRAGQPANLDSAHCASGAAATDGTPAVTASSATRREFAPRWRDQPAAIVTVRIDDADSLAGWNPVYRDGAVSALQAWEAAGSPVRFEIVDGDQAADVKIHWIEKFESRYDGWTTITWDHSGWLVGGDVTLAIRTPAGRLLSSNQRAQVALHEIGHVLGLSHSTSAASIMLPNMKVTAIAPVDLETLQALYTRQSSSGSSRLAASDGRCADPNAEAGK